MSRFDIGGPRPRRSRADRETPGASTRWSLPAAIGLPVLAMVAGLAGCGGGERAEPPAQAPSAQSAAPPAAAPPAGELAGPAASSPSGAARVRGEPHRLEAGFVPGGVFSAQAAERAAQTQERFDALLTALDEGFRSDPEANEIARLFGARFAGALARSGSGVALERLACGQRICAASLRGEKIAAPRLLQTLMSGHEGGAKIGASSITFVQAPGPGAPSGYRLVFSTDPSVSAIVERP